MVKEIMGVDFKGVADRITNGAIWDLKTCQDASPDAFSKIVANYKYHLQAAVYSLLTGRDDFQWLAVEKAPPYNSAVYKLAPASLVKAKADLTKIIVDWQNWNGLPQSYSKEAELLHLPRWA